MPSAVSVASRAAVARSGRDGARRRRRDTSGTPDPSAISDAAVLDEAAGVHRAFGQHAPERAEVVVERLPRQHLQRRPLDVGLVHHHVLLLEVEHRGAHLGVVAAGLVPARVHHPLAGEALLDLGEGEPLGLEAQVLLRVAGGAPGALGERLQVVRARRRRAPPAGAARARGASPAPSARWRRPRSGSDRRRAATSASNARAHAPAASIRKRRRNTDSDGRDAVELQVVAFARRERLPVAVAAVGREPREHRTVADALQDRRRPPVGEIDDGEPARPRRVRVDLRSTAPTTWMARRSGGRSDNAGNASAAAIGCGRGAARRRAAR